MKKLTTYKWNALSSAGPKKKNWRAIIKKRGEEENLEGAQEPRRISAGGATASQETLIVGQAKTRQDKTKKTACTHWRLSR